MKGSIARSGRLTHLAAVIHGGEPIFTPSKSERVARCLIVALFIGLPLFVAVQLSPTAWALITAIALVASHPGALLVPTPRVLRPLLCWAAFAGLAAASASWSIDPPRSLKAGVVLASYVFAGTIMVRYVLMLSEAQQARAWSALVAGATLALLVLTGIELSSLFLPQWDPARTFHKITFYGLIAASLLLADDRRGKVFFVVLFFAVPTLALGKTTGVNLMIFGAALLFLMPNWLLPRLMVVVFGIYCALSLSAPFLSAEAFLWADQSFVSRVKSFGSFMARLDLWQMMSPYILERPWFGHGADTVRVSEFIVQHVKYYDLPDIPSAHNMVFDQWYELGVLGTVALLAILGMTLRDILVSSCRYNLAAAIIFLGFVVEFSVDHRIWLSWVHGTAILAAASLVLLHLRISSATSSGDSTSSPSTTGA
jgi:O-antigen ligase